MSLHLRIHGMDCAEEVAVLKREVGRVVGGEQRLSFDILRARMTVDAPAGVPVEGVLEAVARTGMRAEPWTEQRTAIRDESFWRRHARAAATVASGVLIAAGLVSQVVIVGDLAGALGAEGVGNVHNVPLLARALYGLAVVAGAWFIAPKAWLAARRLRPDMNFLMTVAVIGALAIGEWFEAATVAFLFALALTLKSWSIGRARRAVAALMDLAPPIARVCKVAVHVRRRSPK